MNSQVNVVFIYHIRNNKGKTSIVGSNETTLSLDIVN